MWAILALLFLILLFAPPLTWFLAIICLALTTSVGSRGFRLASGASLILACGVIAASRSVMQSSADDFTHIYTTYQALGDGDTSVIFLYGKGLEGGFPLLLKFISMLSKDLSPNLLMFFLVLFSVTLFQIWLEYFGLLHVPTRLKGIATAMAWVFCSFFLASQISRQFLSTVILLYAFFLNGTLTRLAVVMVAAFVHLSALPIYILVASTIKYKWKAVLLFVIAIFAFTQYLPTILNMTALLADPGFDKLRFYLNNNSSYTSSDIGAFKWMSVPIVLLLLPNMVLSKNTSILNNKWVPVFILFYFICLLLLPFPLMSFRGTFIINAVLLGWIAFVFGQTRPRLLLVVLIFFVLPLKFKAIISTDPNDLMAFWSLYGPIGISPGYYFLKLVSF